MSKLKLRLNQSDLRAVQMQLLLSIRANPMDYLRKHPLDYLVVAELTTIYNKVELKARDMEWFGSTRSLEGKIITLTLTRSEALALYVMLTQEPTESVDNGEDPELPFDGIATQEALTYEVTLISQLVGIIHRAYFV